MYFRFFLVFYGCLLACNQAWAQHAIAYQRTFQSLREELLQGKKMALRDLGSLLDENEIIEIQLAGQKINNRVGSIALQVLKDFTLFEPGEIPLLENTGSLEFLEFYYQHEEQIFFSEFTQTFQIQPFPTEFSEYHLFNYQSFPTGNPESRFKELVAQIRTDLDLDYFDAIPKLILQIGALKTESAHRFLIECLQGRHWAMGRNPREAEIYKNLMFSLRYYPQEETVQALLYKLREEKISSTISPDLLAFSLSMLTNLHPAYPAPSQDDYLSFYQSYFHQFPSLNQLKQKGYQRVFDYTEANFQNPVDYYGTMLNQAYGLFWIKKHAFDDLSAIHHPKTLVYLAAQLFQNRREIQALWYEDLPVVQKIRDLTGINLEVKNAQGQWVKNPENDDTSRLNYLRYWMIHYTDYTWDEQIQRFVNQKDSILPSPDYSALVKKLYVPSEKESIQAFQQLAQIEPQDWALPDYLDQVVSIGDNHWLPSHPFSTLKIFSSWIAYCRLNQLSYQPDPDLQAKLNALRRKIPDIERYQLENNLINQVRADQIQALEYEAILSQNQTWYYNASLARIIDKAYARTWQTWTNESARIREYLKKAALFEKLSIQGTCKNYWQRLDKLTEKQTSFFKEILLRETDADIRLALTRVLKEPLLFQDFKLEDIQNISIQNSQDYQTLRTRIARLKDVEKIKALFNYWAAHLSLESVPALMDLLDDTQIIESKAYGSRTLNYTVADYAVFLLEKIYKHSFADEKDFYNYKPQDIFAFRTTTQDWKNLWISQKTTYKNWEKTFFEQKLSKLSSPGALKINLINTISSSKFYQRKLHFPKIQSVLRQMNPVSDLQYLHIPHTLDWSEIKDVVNNSEHSESIVHLLSFLEESQEHPSEILGIAFKHARVLDDYPRGKFYLDLFQKTQFRQWLSQNPDLVNLSEMQEGLGIYARDFNGYDLEYYAIKKMQFFLNNLNKPLTDQIRTARQITNPDDQSEALEDILLNAGYEGLGEILRNRDSFEQSPYPEIFRGYLRRYIQEDLGIPEEIYDLEGFNRLLQYYRRYDQKSFYLQYAMRFIPDIILPDSSLNYTKIKEVLQFDLTEDFAGIVTGVRYWPVLTVIRLLELDHQTRLGFPENFLHPWAFYRKADIGERVEAWRGFVMENVLEKGR